MSVLLCGDWGGDEAAVWRHHLQLALPGERLLQEGDAIDAATRAAIDVAVVANPPPGQLQGLPGLRLIQSLWAGVDRLLCDTRLPQDVALARMVDPAMTRAMAETALWAVLSLHRGFFRYARQQREAQWRVGPQRRADEVSVAVLGLGQMGSEVAARLAAQGYRVGGWRRQGPAGHLGGVEVFCGADEQAALLQRSSIVINLLPLTDATRGILNASLFRQLPAGAAVVNLARGAHLVEADLLQALDDGHLSHSVLDVFGTEPLPEPHPFWRHPNVTVLPHAAALTDPRSAAAVVADNLAALRAGRPLAHLVSRRDGY